MKCIIVGLLALFFSFVVQADPAVNIMPNQADSQPGDNGKNDRQFLLPSGTAAIPINVTDDNEVEKPAGAAMPPDATKEKSAKSVKEKSTESIKDKAAESIKEKWGVGEFIVRHTSAGYMLDVRYRVFDKEKAKPLFDRKVRPFVIEEASAVKYGVPASPKVGFLRQAPQHIKENKQYFLMIANPGKRIKTGDKLTLVIGDFRIEHLTVE
jgi:hypothetical protein